MSMIIRKRQLITATLAIALGAAIFINWYYTRPETGVSPAVGTESVSEKSSDANAADNLGDAQYVLASTTADEAEYFSKAELDRSKAHDEAKETLNEVIKDEGSAESAVKDASEKLAALSARIKLEADTETLIGAKTGSSCIVILGDDSAEVILPKNVLTDTVLVQIRDIIINKTGFSAEKITIIELKG